jgi:hypothetical protein
MKVLIPILIGLVVVGCGKGWGHLILNDISAKGELIRK